MMAFFMNVVVPLVAVAAVCLLIPKKMGGSRKEVVGIVRRALENHKAIFDDTPSADRQATVLVSELWVSIPDVLSGSYGSKPTSIPLAAAAIAEKVDKIGVGTEEDRELSMALGNVLILAERKNPKTWNGVDYKLLQASQDVYFRKERQRRSSPGDIIGQLGL